MTNSNEKTKSYYYNAVIVQLQSLIVGESDIIANLANIVAVLKETMHFHWVGFYFVKGDELVLGPFQGLPACSRIRKNKGVCGVSWASKKMLYVPDVEKFPGHIACSAETRSEIVFPILREGEVFLLLDIDSNRLNDFDNVDKVSLEKLVYLITMIVNAPIS